MLNIYEMKEQDFYTYCEHLKRDRGEVISLLGKLKKDMPVFVYCKDTKQYTDEFGLWVEGHDHRHFISVDIEFQPKKMTVASLIKELKLAYCEKSRAYADTVAFNVYNKKGLYTSNFECRIKNGNLYLFGKKPVYQYLNKYYELNK